MSPRGTRARRGCRVNVLQDPIGGALRRKRGGAGVARIHPVNRENPSGSRGLRQAPPPGLGGCWVRWLRQAQPPCAASGLARHVGGGLVRPQAAPAGLAQDSAGRELRELDLADQLGSHPQGVAGIGIRNTLERIRIGPQGLEQRGSFARVCSPKPEPTRPAYCRPSPCGTPTSREPIVPARLPLPGRMPPITTSCVRECFTLSHCPSAPRADTPTRDP